MQFTRNQFASLVALYKSGGFIQKNPIAVSGSSRAAYLATSEEQWFQVLLVDVDENGLSSTKIVYGQKSRLATEYGITDLPSNGVNIAQGFVSPDEIGKYSAVRFFLQSRKLSQMVVLTWVDEDDVPDEQKLEVKLIREIFEFYNNVPETFFLNQQGLAQISSIQLKQTILQAEENNELLVSYLIKPEYASYSSIRLALLLCGQAYYKNPSMQQYGKIGASIPGLENGIFSTYEMVWQCALDISWSSFHGTQSDLSQTGIDPNPPSSLVTLPYPPRPSEFSVSQSKIKEWAFASVEEGSFPFYPPEGSSDWEQGAVMHIVPPYPFLPLTST